MREGCKWCRDETHHILLRDLISSVRTNVTFCSLSRCVNTICWTQPPTTITLHSPTSLRSGMYSWTSHEYWSFRRSTLLSSVNGVRAFGSNTSSQHELRSLFTTNSSVVHLSVGGSVSVSLQEYGRFLRVCFAISSNLFTSTHFLTASVCSRTGGHTGRVSDSRLIARR